VARGSRATRPARSSTTPRKHHNGGGGGWFAYTAGPIRFIVLNTNLPPALGGDDAQTQVIGPLIISTRSQ
jgi:hypothetical protein